MAWLINGELNDTELLRLSCDTSRVVDHNALHNGVQRVGT